ncbi:uncharacterized protein KY384_005609 [Bacidia gigantensis]|uniref:uncharacterized protein n=1 Tax=Bacidia gigantensis TaxID=2732470 RepID=UPI001D044DD4|nr:uncharacterized protein KY384_005609 [Bacidia gigantensis]KAG8530126.1 hypothetical protein KY384_005609 [Bacidia gigantensis]
MVMAAIQLDIQPADSPRHTQIDGTPSVTHNTIDLTLRLSIQPSDAPGHTTIDGTPSATHSTIEITPLLTNLKSSSPQQGPLSNGYPVQRLPTHAVSIPTPERDNVDQQATPNVTNSTQNLRLESDPPAEVSLASPNGQREEASDSRLDEDINENNEENTQGDTSG